MTVILKNKIDAKLTKERVEESIRECVEEEVCYSVNMF